MSKRLESQVKRYMKENDIPQVEIRGDETLVLEPIPHGERAMWIRMWLNGKLATKRLHEKIREFAECGFQWAQWDTKDFLKAVKEPRGFDIG